MQAAAGEWHWHGAGPATFMTHLAVQDADGDGQTTMWGDHVTDEEYPGAAIRPGWRRVSSPPWARPGTRERWSNRSST